MSEVPFRFWRVTYVYNFRMMNVPPDLPHELKGKNYSSFLDCIRFNPFVSDATDGFQAYIQTKRSVASCRSPGISWWDLMPKGTSQESSGEVALLRAMRRDFPTVTIVDTAKRRTRQSAADQHIDIHDMQAFLSSGIIIDANGEGSLCLTLLLHSHQPQMGTESLALSQCLAVLNMAEESIEQHEKHKPPRKRRRYRLTIGPQKTGKVYSLWEIACNEIMGFRDWLRRILPRTSRPVTWLCHDGDGHAMPVPPVRCVSPRNEFDEKASGFPAQNPYVYTEMEVATLHDYEELVRRDHVDCGINCLRALLPQMLVRVGPTGVARFGINKDYLIREGADPDHRYFASFYPVEYLHIWAHFRSTIAVFPRLDDPQLSQGVSLAIARFLLALRDTVREVRTRWHFLVMEHAYIDYLVRELHVHWNRRENLEKEFGQIQDILLNIRFNSIYLMENPIVHRRAASSLNWLYVELEKAFGSTRMQDELRHKLAQLLNIYEECVRIRFREMRK